MKTKVKTITLNFRNHIGDGGYGFLFRYTWRVRSRIYIKGYWTPFMIVDWKFKTEEIIAWVLAIAFCVAIMSAFF